MSSERILSEADRICHPDLIQALDALGVATDIDELFQALCEAALKLGSAGVVETALTVPDGAKLRSVYALHSSGDRQRLFPDIGRAHLIQVTFQESQPQVGFLNDLDRDGSGYHILTCPIPSVAISTKDHDPAIGVIALGYPTPPSTPPRLLQSLDLLSTHFALRLQQFLAERMALLRKARIDLVAEISAMVVQQGANETLFTTAIRRIEEVYNLDVAALYAGHPLTLRLLSHGHATRLGTPVPDPIAARMPQDGVPRIIPDLSTVDGGSVPPWAPAEARTEVMIPLTYHQRHIGILDFYGSHCELQETEDLKILDVLGQQLALLIVQERQEESGEATAQRSTAEAALEPYGSAEPAEEGTSYDTQQLQLAYDRLQEFAELKDQILQNISHELRTPLTLVKGYLELMMAGEMGELASEQMESLRMVVGKVDDVTRIVDGIVSLSPLNRLSVSQQRISVAELIAELALVFVQRTQGTDITWNFEPLDEDLYLSGDIAQIRQVFYNILDNSVKFSPEGGEIQVKALSEQGYVHLIFRDTGVGIPQPRLTRIFETFYQVDGSSTRRFGGLGLGLAVVARVVRAHNGKVWAESELGKGSTFHILLPKYRSPHQVFQPAIAARG